MFLLNQKIVSPLVNVYDIIPLFAAEFEEPKIGISGKWSTYQIQVVKGYTNTPQMILYHWIRSY